MVYYSHVFYRMLANAYYVNFDEDVLLIRTRENDEQVKRVPYSEMSEMEARAALHYIGMRIRALQEAFRKL